MTGKGSGKRGRPMGFRLSDVSKQSISMSKTGQKHRQETKDKISKSLIMYFRQKNTLSEELSNYYCRMVVRKDLNRWLREFGDAFDVSSDIMTEKSLRNRNKIEITCGNDIEYFSHSLTPEVIMLFKEHCELNNFNPEDIL